MNFQCHIYEGACSAVSTINIPRMWRHLLGNHHDAVLYPIKPIGSGLRGCMVKIQIILAKVVTLIVYVKNTFVVQGRKDAVLNWIDSTVHMMLYGTAGYQLTSKGKED